MKAPTYSRPKRISLRSASRTERFHFVFPSDTGRPVQTFRAERLKVEGLEFAPPSELTTKCVPRSLRGARLSPSSSSGTAGEVAVSATAPIAQDLARDLQDEGRIHHARADP